MVARVEVESTNLSVPNFEFGAFSHFAIERKIKNQLISQNAKPIMDIAIRNPIAAPMQYDLMNSYMLLSIGLKYFFIVLPKISVS